MKILIKDNAGLQAEIDPKNIEVNGQKLATIFARLEILEKELKLKQSRDEAREKELITLWGKIKRGK